MRMPLRKELNEAISAKVRSALSKEQKPRMVRMSDVLWDTLKSYASGQGQTVSAEIRRILIAHLRDQGVL